MIILAIAAAGLLIEVGYLLGMNSVHKMINKDFKPDRDIRGWNDSSIHDDF